MLKKRHHQRIKKSSKALGTVRKKYRYKEKDSPKTINRVVKTVEWIIQWPRIVASAGKLSEDLANNIPFAQKYLGFPSKKATLINISKDTDGFLLST